MGQIKQIYVTNVVCNDERKFGFARIVETGEEVFIPPHIVVENQPEKKSLHVAEIEDNFDGHQVKFRVKMIFDPDGPFRHLLSQYNVEQKAEPVEVIPPAPREPTHKEITHWIVNLVEHHNDTFLSTSELSRLITRHYNHSIESEMLGRIAENMARNGKLAKLLLYSTAQNKAAIRKLWGSQLTSTHNFDRMFTSDQT